MSFLRINRGNLNCIRNVTIDNCVITDSNRGLAFMVFDGGYVSDVVMSNLTIDCRRYDWFWWGDGDPFHFNVIRRSEIHPEIGRPDEPPAGAIRNVLIKNVIARGKGPSVMNGHPQSWLDGITMEDITLIASTDPNAPYQKAGHALTVQRARNLRLDHVEVRWEAPHADHWQSALYLEDVQGLELSGFKGQQAIPGSSHPTVQFNRVEDAVICHCQAAFTSSMES